MIRVTFESLWSHFLAPTPGSRVFGLGSRVFGFGSRRHGGLPKTPQKRLGEDAKGLLDPASTKPLAPVRNVVARVQKVFWVVQKTLGRPLLPGSKRPFEPSPNHFGDFPCSGRSAASQMLESLLIRGGKTFKSGQKEPQNR